MSVASIIHEQIGHSALFMIGAKNLIGLDDGLRFNIMRNNSGANRVTVTLTPADTYTVEFSSFRKSKKDPEGYTNNVKASFRDVHADGLHELIAYTTGLALKFR